MNIEIILAALDQMDMLTRLLELYAEDFREFHTVQMGPDGRFVYEKLPLYWSEAGRHPFLVMVDGTVAGFVFVKRGSEISCDPQVWDMAEFFVRSEARRQGVGMEIARQVWGRFPGRWEVRVMAANQPALDFWSQAITNFAGERILADRVEKDGEAWHLFSFESGASGTADPPRSAKDDKGKNDKGIRVATGGRRLRAGVIGA